MRGASDDTVKTCDGGGYDGDDNGGDDDEACVKRIASPAGRRGAADPWRKGSSP